MQFIDGNHAVVICTGHTSRGRCAYVASTCILCSQCDAVIVLLQDEGNNIMNGELFCGASQT